MEAIDTLTGGIAHDFNNLLMIIMGKLSLAELEVEAGSRLAGFLDEINMACFKTRDLIHELMSFAREGTYIREPGSLESLMKTAEKLVSSNQQPHP